MNPQLTFLLAVERQRDFLRAAGRTCCIPRNPRNRAAHSRFIRLPRRRIGAAETAS